MRTRRPAWRIGATGASSLIGVALLGLLAILAAPPSSALTNRAQPDQPASLTLLSSPATILPGSTGDFRFSITNSSGSDRTFIFTTSITGGVTVSFPSGAQVSVADGSAAEFIVSALVPTSAVPGSTLTQTMIASSSAPTSLQLSTVFTVLVGGPTPTPTPTLALVYSPFMVGRDAPRITPTSSEIAPIATPPMITPPLGTPPILTTQTLVPPPGTQTIVSTPPSTTTPTAYLPETPTIALPSAPRIKISDVFCRDPAYPDNSEYIDLRNDGTTTVDLTGWQVVNTSRDNIRYTFPSYTMGAGPDFYVTLYSGVGDNRPDFAEFYWGRTDQLWYVGDRAELRDARGALIDRYTVSASNCS